MTFIVRLPGRHSNCTDGVYGVKNRHAPRSATFAVCALMLHFCTPLDRVGGVPRPDCTEDSRKAKTKTVFMDRSQIHFSY